MGNLQVRSDLSWSDERNINENLSYVDVSDVVVTKRHRQDLGELTGLMSSMRDVGLLHPIVLNSANQLISGERRLAAAKQLGWKAIPATIARTLDDAIMALKAERDENIERKNFTKVEACALFNDLLKLEKPGADRRKKEAASKGGKTAGRGRPQKSDSQVGRSHMAKEEGVAKARAAKAAGYDRRTMEKVEAIMKFGNEDLIDELKRTDNATAVYKKLQARLKLEEQERATADLSRTAKERFLDVCDLRHCTMQELLVSVKPDCIITDPPYPEEFLALYGELAALAKSVPLVAVMCGQSYLPEILASMCTHLKYRWMLAYLTPGGQAVQVWNQKVNTFWKPVLLFGEVPESWIGDVATSAVNDNDKRFHDWGQSESGMGDLIERLTQPGQLICDPFLGAGTTAVAALQLGRRFVGCDIDAASVKTATTRCGALYA